MARKSPKPTEIERPEGLEMPVPVPLDEVVGHARARETLQRAMRSGRIHHAWIFHGPVGVGKCTLALAFGAMLLDPTAAPNLAGDIDVDPESPTQRLIRAGSHPDFHLVTKELARYHADSKIRERKLTTIPKEVIEDHLLKPSRLSGSTTGGMASKVFIVDEAELLAQNAAAQNALLKTLEEPAPGTVIILVTSSEERLLPTIRSRSQRVAFAPLTDDEMRRWIGDRPVPRAGLLLAGGSPGMLEMLTESGLLEWHVQLEPALDQLASGRYVPDLAPTMASLVDAWAVQWVESHENASKDAANKQGVRHMLRLVSEDRRRRLRHATEDPDEMERHLRAIDDITTAEHQILRNVQAPFVFEGLVARLARS
ncbi:MAG: AAA family ATPase [Phycisphaerales bacterium]|nr:AAA family ATPase [Phycisphaerales bacterium]